MPLHFVPILFSSALYLFLYLLFFFVRDMNMSQNVTQKCNQSQKCDAVRHDWNGMALRLLTDTDSFYGWGTFV